MRGRSDAVHRGDRSRSAPVLRAGARQRGSDGRGARADQSGAVSHHALRLSQSHRRLGGAAGDSPGAGHDQHHSGLAGRLPQRLSADHAAGGVHLARRAAHRRDAEQLRGSGASHARDASAGGGGRRGAGAAGGPRAEDADAGVLRDGSGVGVVPAEPAEGEREHAAVDVEGVLRSARYDQLQRCGGRRHARSLRSSRSSASWTSPRRSRSSTHTSRC